MRLSRHPVSSMALLLGLAPIGVPLAAQEQPHPPPDYIERTPATQRIEVFSTRRGRLGVVVSPASPQTDTIGALIQSVTPNGPADKAGIRSGDIIVRVNGRSLALSDARQAGPPPNVALALIAAELTPGDSVVVQYQRSKDRRNTTLVVGDDPVWTLVTRDGVPFDVQGHVFERMLGPQIRMRVDAGPPRAGEPPLRVPMPRMYMLGTPLADLELAPLNPDLGRYFGTADGVLVINVPPESKLGLRAGDVVFAVDGRQVATPAQLLRTLQSYDPGETFKLDIMRMKKRETVSGVVQQE